ncbi:hypothetical protein H4R24_004056 [Coemansia sp. RSA 988]|nr:hypothetical protein H4R24_004056 [Coemansia sp. RSA 988]
MDHTETIREAKFSRDSEVARAASGATAEGGSAVSKRDSEMVSTYETHKDEGSIPLVNQNSVSDITHARFGMAEARPETPSSDLRPSRPEAQDTGTETTTMKPSNVFSSPNPVVKWASDERKHPERTEAGQTGDAKHEISQAAGGDAVVVESKDQDNADPGSNSHAGQAVAAGLVEATTPTTAGSMEQAHEFAIGSSKSAASMAEEQQLRNWKKNIGMVWREISGHRFGSMFLSAIKSADAPHYYEVIRQPLDLKTIKNRIRDEDITTTVEFYRDIMHMLMNALMYNSEDTEVYQMAMEILPDAQACVEQLLQTEAVVIQPKDGAGSSGATEVAITANTVAVSNEEDARNDDHDGEDSDASAPAKRRRRVASERASKHLRA